MTKKQFSPYAWAARLGITLLTFTFLFSMIFWMGEITAAMRPVPIINYMAFYVFWMGASAFAFLRGGEETRKLAFTSLYWIFLFVWLTTAVMLLEYLIPILKTQLPTWPPYLWAIFGAVTAISLLAISLVGPYLKQASLSSGVDDAE